jgi:serine/threonine protein phosphatase 1
MLASMHIAELLTGARNWLTALGRAQSGAESFAPSQSEDHDAIYAVGDIHGRLDLLMELEDLIRADIAKHDRSQSLLVYLGDYIDRGESSFGVIEHLSRRPALCQTEVFLRGNHEQVLLDFLGGADVLENWSQFGGLETLSSYGVEASQIGDYNARDACREQFRAAMPHHHLAFLTATLPCFETAGHFFAHAGVNPEVPLHLQDNADLMWIRDEFLTADAHFEKRIIHGHTPAPQPEILPHRINVDTGAYHTGLLSCAVIEGEACRILSTIPAFE